MNEEALGNLARLRYCKHASDHLPRQPSIPGVPRLVPATFLLILVQLQLVHASHIRVPLPKRLKTLYLNTLQIRPALRAWPIADNGNDIEAISRHDRGRQDGRADAGDLPAAAALLQPEEGEGVQRRHDGGGEEGGLRRAGEGGGGARVLLCVPCCIGC